MGGPGKEPGVGTGWTIGLGTSDDLAAVSAGDLGIGAGTLFWGGG